MGLKLCNLIWKSNLKSATSAVASNHESLNVSFWLAFTARRVSLSCKQFFKPVTYKYPKMTTSTSSDERKSIFFWLSRGCFFDYVTVYFTFFVFFHFSNSSLCFAHFSFLSWLTNYILLRLFFEKQYEFYLLQTHADWTLRCWYFPRVLVYFLLW